LISILSAARAETPQQQQQQKSIKFPKKEGKKMMR